MGKVHRLNNKVEPLAALFWAHGIVLANMHLTLPAGPASLHRRTQSMSLYGHSRFNSQQRSVAPPPLFSHLGTFFTWRNN